MKFFFGVLLCGKELVDGGTVNDLENELNFRLLLEGQIFVLLPSGAGDFGIPLDKLLVPLVNLEADRLKIRINTKCLKLLRPKRKQNKNK